jgi:hypothetical protein
MEKTKIYLIFLSIAAIILITSLIFSGTEINSYSYTKAICDETNYCEDYEINCEGNKIFSMKFTGAAVQNSFNWKDPRDKETIEKLC